MARLIATVFLLGASVAVAQERDTRWELGLRYWYSTGSLQWSHNAQGSDPFAGNPTSLLTYEDATAHAIELHARRNLGTRWFVRGLAGLGGIHDGSLSDEDFAVGQLRFSQSESPVKGNRLTYFTFDVGRDVWANPERATRLGLFAGYNRWRERLDTYGATWPVNLVFANPDLPGSVPFISNDAIWQSLRLGAAFETRMASRTRLAIDAAWVPYARLQNDDSHWLRADFGPPPNVLIRGRGHGVQLDLAVKHAFGANWEASAGVRHWRLTTTRGTVDSATFSAPLVELESQRTGFTLGLTRLW